MPFKPDIKPMAPEIVRSLAPSGVLRAGINLSNFLLVSSKTPDGGPAGVSPDIARAIADSLGLPIAYLSYASPGPLAEAATRDEWDIALIGAEPQRAGMISFTPAYAEIEASYLVQPGSNIQMIAEVDRAGNRIAVKDRTAYGLWLDRNIRHADLIRSNSFDSSLASFRDQKLEALAGLRPGLIEDQKAVAGSRILDGRFMAVQQAIGVPKAKAIANEYLTDFVMAARASGFIADLIRKHGVSGLTAL